MAIWKIYGREKTKKYKKLLGKGNTGVKPAPTLCQSHI